MRNRVFEKITVHTVANLVTALIFGFNANAQGIDTTRQGAYELKETVVTARPDLKTLRAASPLYKLNSSQMLRQGVTDISDAIHRLPGVTLRDYGGAGGMKTISVRGLGAAHTTVIFDGMPLSDIQSSAVDLSRYSIDNIEELSLVIGENDDIFTPVKVAASPAMLNIATPGLDFDKVNDLAVQLKGGAFGYISPFLRYNRRLSSSVILGFTGEYLHTKNNYPFKLVNGNTVTTERRENNLINSGHLETNLRVKTRNDGDLKAKIYYYDNDRQLPGPVLYYNVNASKEHLRDRNFFMQASFSQHLASRWQIMANAKFNWAASLYTDFGSRQTGNYVEENYFQREYYLNVCVLFVASKNWNFDYSADYIFNNLNSNLTTDSRPVRNSILQSLTAKWSVPRINVTARVIESVYRNSSKPGTKSPDNRNRLSPSFTFTGRLLNEGLLYARLSYKNIFRMPSFNEAFFNHYGSSDLKPESTDQFNLGLTWQAPSTKRLSQLLLTADVYRNRVKDRIVAIPYNMFIWTVTNLNSVHTTGTDITASAALNLGKRHLISATGTWSYQRAKINAPESDPVHNKQVAYIPLNSGSFSITYENPWVNAVVHGQGSSARYTDNSNIPVTRLPGYFEFGAALWRDFYLHGNRWQLRGDLLNFLDKQYQVIGRYPMPGRSWQVTIKFSI